MVEILDNYLLAFLAAVFIPTFIYLVKMVTEMATIKTNIDGLKTEINIRINEVCKDLVRMEKDIESLFNRLTHREKGDRA